jgi:predicted dehydrogenase
MNDSRIKEVYALKSHVPGANEMRGAVADQADSNLHRLYQPEAVDIPIITWTYEDPACHGVWMRADSFNGKHDPMCGFTLSLLGEKGMIEVLGEGGRGLQWRGKDVHLVLHRRIGETETFRFDEGADEIWQSEVSYYSRAHTNLIHEFIDALTNGREPRYTGVDGWRAVKNTMAAICSAKEGVAVKVSEVTDDRFQR